MNQKNNLERAHIVYLLKGMRRQTTKREREPHTCGIHVRSRNSSAAHYYTPHQVHRQTGPKFIRTLNTCLAFLEPRLDQIKKRASLEAIQNILHQTQAISR